MIITDRKGIMKKYLEGLTPFHAGLIGGVLGSMLHGVVYLIIQAVRLQ